MPVTGLGEAACPTPEYTQLPEGSLRRPLLLGHPHHPNWRPQGWCALPLVCGHPRPPRALLSAYTLMVCARDLSATNI